MTALLGDTRPLPHPPILRQPGYLRRIFTDPQPVLDELRDQYGPLVGLGAGPMRMAIVGDPEALHELFRMPTDSFRWDHKFNALGFVGRGRDGGAGAFGSTPASPCTPGSGGHGS